MISSFMDKIKLISLFIKGCHDKRYWFHCKELPNNSIDQMKELSLHLHELSPLLAGLDNRSIATAIRFLHRGALISDEDDDLLLDSISAVTSDVLRSFEQQKSALSEKYRISKDLLKFQVFGSKMGIPQLPAEVQQYMKDKIFLDCGAFIGDSSLVMLDFQPSKIYAFDASPKNAETFHEIMKKNQIPESKIELILSGISDSEGDISFSDAGNGSTSLYSNGETKIHVSTIDKLCENMDRIGFIKADIEGFGLKMAKGMVSILKRDRPVLSLAIYHNSEEFYEIKPFIESLNLNYKFEIMAHDSSYDNEIYLQAYPAELTVK